MWPGDDARKNWDRQQEPVKYCSKQCRTRRIRPVDRMLEAAIVALLRSARQRQPLPSEAARRVKPEGWEMLMEPCRMAARQLVAQGCAEITQNKRVVDPSTARPHPSAARSAVPHREQRWVVLKCGRSGSAGSGKAFVVAAR